MAAMAKIAADANAVPWFHEIVRQEKAEPVETDKEIIDRIKNGINKIGGSDNGPI